jgi:hypothetical protein
VPAIHASGRKAAEVVSDHIITDMYAKAVEGTPAEQGARRARRGLQRIDHGTVFSD